MATEQDHADAVIAAYNAEGKYAYMLDAIPYPRPPKYLEVTVTRRYGGVQRFSGTWDGQLYRITARAVGSRVDGAREMRELCYAIEGQSLVIAGQLSTPVEFETADAIEPDEGKFSAPASFTYALI